jgi:hypothetical protein
MFINSFYYATRSLSKFASCLIVQSCGFDHDAPYLVTFFATDITIDYYMSNKSAKEYFTKETILKAALSTAISFAFDVTCLKQFNKNDTPNVYFALSMLLLFNLTKFATEALVDYIHERIQNTNDSIALEVHPVEIIGQVEA